ncbi:hypothetical protein EMGBS15_14710 [Filimonas sp.]|nr:hypothetical protein EMGBS15_14710 [Filimonas sp.]
MRFVRKQVFEPAYLIKPFDHRRPTADDGLSSAVLLTLTQYLLHFDQLTINALF